MRYISIFLLLFCLEAAHIAAQSTAYVFQGGLTAGTQTWDNSYNRGLLFQYHGALAIESLNNENDDASLYMQVGYHVKGSATQFRYFNFSGGAFQSRIKFKFNNVSLILGAKQKKPLGSGTARWYYFGGIRGDYTVSTNLDELVTPEELAQNPYLLYVYPYVGGVRRWNAGVSAGMGVELPLADLAGLEFKLSVHPDFTYQYRQPPLGNVTDPYTMQTISIGERQVRNTAIELSVGLRLIRKVVYEE